MWKRKLNATEFIITDKPTSFDHLQGFIILQAFLVTYSFEEYNIILMFSTNTGQFQLIFLCLMQIACWLIEWSGEEGK